MIEKRLDRATRGAKSGDKAAKAEAELFTGLLDHVSAGRAARDYPVPDALLPAYRECHLLSAKPVLYVANVDDASLAQGNPYSDALEAHAKQVSAGAVRICGQVEAELAELDDDEKREFLEELGVEEPGLDRLIHAAYVLLELITFFTAGEKEVRAWTVRRGGRHPFRLRDPLHSRRSDPVPDLRGRRRRGGGEEQGPHAGRGQGVRSPRRRRDALSRGCLKRCGPPPTASKPHGHTGTRDIDRQTIDG